MTIYFSLLVAIIGLAIYIMAEKPKPVEIGRIAYAMGLLAFLLQGVEHIVALVK